MRLIDVSELTMYTLEFSDKATDEKYSLNIYLAEHIKDASTINATVLPCKIGDYAYAIRNYKGHIHPQRGVVSEMYFLPNRNGGMKLCVAVKNVARGEWGKTIFGTKEEAIKAIEERKKKC